MLPGLRTDVGNVVRDFLRAQLGLARRHLVALDVDGGKPILLDQALAHQNGVLVVAALPA